MLVKCWSGDVVTWGRGDVYWRFPKRHHPGTTRSVVALSEASQPGTPL